MLTIASLNVAEDCTQDYQRGSLDLKAAPDSKPHSAPDSPERGPPL